MINDQECDVKIIYFGHHISYDYVPKLAHQTVMLYSLLHRPEQHCLEHS